MKFILCTVLGIVLGFIIFYLMWRIANNNKKRKKAKRKAPNFTKLVLIAILSTYFIGLVIGIYVTLMDYTQFGVLATYIATPTTTVIALYCWKAKAENILKIKKSYPEETKDCSIDFNNL